MKDKNITKTQMKTMELICSDLHFMYSVTMQNKKYDFDVTYFISLLPYIGVITGGVEQWSHKVDGIMDIVDRFSQKEKDFYEKLRNNIKLWDESYQAYSDKLKARYREADIYFSNECKWIAKVLHIYDVFGCYIIDGEYCGNTILNSIYVPYFSYTDIQGQYIKEMAEFLGKLCVTYQVDKLASLDLNFEQKKFYTRDYGGFVKSPVRKHEFSDEFALFSILCSINFVIYGIDDFIESEEPIKLRCAYLQYYYISCVLPEINKYFKTRFVVETSLLKKEIRNSMAHYGLGTVMKPNEVDMDDAFGGLTEKYLGRNWIDVKDQVIQILINLSQQFKKHLSLK